MGVEMAVGMAGKFKTRYINSSYVMKVAGVANLDSTFPVSVDLAKVKRLKHVLVQCF